MVSRWEIIEKETVDEIIFRTVKVRNRLILELMARGGMRIGEVLKLRLIDILDRKLILREPKSGKEHEIVFIPQKVADRLRDYATKKCQSPQERIFPISYEAARMMVLKAGKLVGIHLRPHDLRRHSATYASTKVSTKLKLSLSSFCKVSGLYLTTESPLHFGGASRLKVAMIRCPLSFKAMSSELTYPFLSSIFVRK